MFHLNMINIMFCVNEKGEYQTKPNTSIDNGCLSR